MSGALLRRLCVAALIAVLVGAAGFAQLHAAGDAAPNVELRGPKGQRQRLADFRGKIVLLKIWASWCPTARSSSPSWIDCRESSNHVALKSSPSTWANIARTLTRF